VVLKERFNETLSTAGGVVGFLFNKVGTNVIAMFIAFGSLYWVTMSRIIRGQILQLKQQEYVTAARALGARGGRIIRKHLLPNCIGQIVTTTFLQIPSAIFLESFLSYLGVGVDTPMTSLGSMCSDALGGLITYPERLFIPAAILSIMILCLNLVGDGLRDALDPKLKK
jgi:ABC-type dipeptide/oligopeptide/nickel transport system permease subunit